MSKHHCIHRIEWAPYSVPPLATDDGREVDSAGVEQTDDKWRAEDVFRFGEQLPSEQAARRHLDTGPGLRGS